VSATIRWRPIPDGADLSIMSPQTFMQMVREGLGRDPFDGGCLTEDDLPVIRGMHAGALAGVAHRSVSGGDMADGLQRLIKALERHGRITLSVQY
jgi:hypothetical protein